jgi:cytochrome c peroxidase
MTALLSHAQTDNNPQPETAVVNSQPDSTSSPSAGNDLLGLPPSPIPANNPQTPAKIELGDKLFHDKRFSVDGTVSCANCHNDKLPFTDNLVVSTGHNGLTGTRNATTVVNAAFNKSQFWMADREPDLEGQSKQPYQNEDKRIPSQTHYLPTFIGAIEISNYPQKTIALCFGLMACGVTSPSHADEFNKADVQRFQ